MARFIEMQLCTLFLVYFPHSLDVIALSNLMTGQCIALLLLIF